MIKKRVAIGADEFAKRLSERAHITIDRAYRLIDEFENELISSICEADSVMVGSLGRFSKKWERRQFVHSEYGGGVTKEQETLTIVLKLGGGRERELNLKRIRK